MGPTVNGVNSTTIKTFRGLYVSGTTKNVDGISVQFGAATPTPTPTISVTPTRTPTPTPTPTPTSTPTPTPTPSITPTNTPTPTSSPEPTPTASPYCLCTYYQLQNNNIPGPPPPNPPIDFFFVDCLNNPSQITLNDQEIQFICACDGSVSSSDPQGTWMPQGECCYDEPSDTYFPPPC